MNICIPKIRNINDLAKYFPVSEKQLLKYIGDEHKEEIIRVQKIYKYSGKFRDVAIVLDMDYKLILKITASYMQHIYKPDKCVRGYVKGGNIVNNAKMHLDKKFVIRADISNFFYSIAKDQIRPVFIEYGANEEIVTTLSEIATFRNILFPGLNTSPILSNMYCFPLDNEMIRIAKKYDCDYSRYADDLIISGNHDIPQKKEIEGAVESFGFSINEKKYKIMKKGRYQVVTGLTVTDRIMPRIPRDIKRRIRLACFLAGKKDSKIEYDDSVEWFPYEYLRSILRYYYKIEPHFVEKVIVLTKGKVKI